MSESIERLAFRKISDYVLVRAIGRGTHSTLYQAVDPRFGRMVLIKILHVTVGKDAPESELATVLETRLHREAQALSSLSHPGIPAIYETGEEDGHPFLVMEYLYGHPLRQHLDKKPLPLDEALPVLEQVASALDAVHAQGILHRDVRASNIMLLQDGQVKLVEFGLARQPGDTTVTLMGTLVGEPSYLAPEQLRSEPASPQTDLWALGVLLYEMLAGKPPFEGANFQMTAHQVLMSQPAPVPDLSEAVQAVLKRALEKDPDQRYSRGQEMVAALHKATGRSFRVTRPPQPSFTRSAAAKPGFRWARTVWVVLVVTLLAGLAWELHTFSRTPTAYAAVHSPPVLRKSPGSSGGVRRGRPDIRLRLRQ